MACSISLTGMDPFARRFMWGVIQDYGTLMFSTQFVLLAFASHPQGMNSRISSDPTVDFSGRGREAETIRGRVDHALHGRSRGEFLRDQGGAK